MIENLSVYDRGVSVSVDIVGDSLRVTDYGDTIVSVNHLGATFTRVPDPDAKVTTRGTGYAVKKDGTVGSSKRSNVYVRAAELPEDVRATLVQAAREAFARRGAHA